MKIRETIKALYDGGTLQRDIPIRSTQRDRWIITAVNGGAFNVHAKVAKKVLALGKAKVSSTTRYRDGTLSSETFRFDAGEAYVSTILTGPNPESKLEAHINAVKADGNVCSYFPEIAVSGAKANDKHAMVGYQFAIEKFPGHGVQVPPQRMSINVVSYSAVGALVSFGLMEGDIGQHWVLYYPENYIVETWLPEALKEVIQRANMLAKGLVVITQSSMVINNVLVYAKNFRWD